MEYRRVAPKSIVHISVAEAASNFASLLARVRVESAEFVIEEQGQPVAVLSPVGPLDLPARE
jgi:antitoxin (DNA-binding transcriptional repressor) of toxin-antitoxin stability system